MPIGGARVTYTMQELADYRPFHVVGTGATRAAAVAEANAKLAMTCGIQGVGMVSEQIAVGEAGTANADTSFSNAEITLQNGSGKKVTVTLDNVTTAIGNGISGQVDTSNDLVKAFATAYRDGAGLGGYTPFSGHFIR